VSGVAAGIGGAAGQLFIEQRPQLEPDVIALAPRQVPHDFGNVGLDEGIRFHGFSPSRRRFMTVASEFHDADK
jgi:hypothetical protein